MHLMSQVNIHGLDVGVILKRVFTEFSSKSGLFKSFKRHVSMADIVTTDLICVSVSSLKSERIGSPKQSQLSDYVQFRERE